MLGVLKSIYRNSYLRSVSLLVTILGGIATIHANYGAIIAQTWKDTVYQTFSDVISGESREKSASKPTPNVPLPERNVLEVAPEQQARPSGEVIPKTKREWNSFLATYHDYSPIDEKDTREKIASVLASDCSFDIGKVDDVSSNACDFEAGYEFDHQNVGWHKAWDDISAADAIRTCAIVAVHHRCVGRLLFQLARSIDKAQNGRSQKDYSVPRTLYMAAEKLGSTGATINLGDMHFFGKGVPIDKDLGNKFFEASARAGSKKFASVLYQRYRFGEHVLGYTYPIDRGKARSFLEIYADEDAEFAYLLARDIIDSQPSNEELVLAERHLTYGCRNDYALACFVRAKLLDVVILSRIPKNSSKAAKIYVRGLRAAKRLFKSNCPSWTPGESYDEKCSPSFHQAQLSWKELSIEFRKELRKSLIDANIVESWWEAVIGSDEEKAIRVFLSKK